jgi:DNA-binding MarR family transcriptional regulator
MTRVELLVQLGKVEAELRAKGVAVQGTPHAKLLAYLATAGEAGVRVGDVAEAFGISASSASTALMRAARDGLVEATPPINDHGHVRYMLVREAVTREGGEFL